MIIGDIFRYHIYGLHLQSSEHIPGLVPDARISTPDTFVHLNAKPSLGKHASNLHRVVYASPERDPHGIPLLLVRDMVEESLYRLSYGDGSEFFVDYSGSQIWCAWPDPLTVDDAATYLLGPVLACVLRLKGT